MLNFYRGVANDDLRRLLDQEIGVRVKIQSELTKMEKVCRSEFSSFLSNPSSQMVTPLFGDLENNKAKLDAKSKELASVLNSKKLFEAEAHQAIEEWKARFGELLCLSLWGVNVGYLVGGF